MEGHRWRMRVKNGPRVHEIDDHALRDWLCAERPLTIVVSQRNRGGLRTWPAIAMSADLWVCLASGDDVARAVGEIARLGAEFGWPVQLVVSGSLHARRRIESSSYRFGSAGLRVAIVAGR